MTMDPCTQNERVYIRVSGHVQNVGFRAHILEAGKRLELNGWARNVGYDEVETVVEGTRPALEAFIELVCQGPRASRVDDSSVQWLQATGEFSNFKIVASR